MPALNKVMLIGNLGADPEIAATRDNRPVAKISLATNHKYKDKQGQKQERTTWHRVVFFDKLAEIVNQYLKKGSLCFVEGKLNTRSWQDPESGQTRYMTEVVGERMQMLDGQAPAAPQSQPGGYMQGQPETPDYSDDIPF